MSINDTPDGQIRYPLPLPNTLLWRGLGNAVASGSDLPADEGKLE